MGVRNYPVTAQILGAPPPLLGFYGGRGGTFMKEVPLFHHGLLSLSIVCGRHELSSPYCGFLSA